MQTMRSPGALAALLVASLTPLPTCAAVRVGLGIEQYRWQETFPSGAAADREAGARETLFLRDSVVLSPHLSVALASKLAFGHPAYTGQTQAGVPISLSTTNVGIDSALLGVWHGAFLGQVADYALGLGYNLWDRDLHNPAGGDQLETWKVIYARAGLEVFQHRQSGWHAGADLIYPLRVTEDIHLTALGGDANPALSPGRTVGYRLTLGYRFRHWDLSGSWQHQAYSRSAPMAVSFSGMPATVYQPRSVNDLYGVALAYRF